MNTTSTIPSVADAKLLEALTTCLIERLLLPRPLSAQVSNALAGNYSTSESDYGVFFTEQLATLDDYEIDLTFSPQFTPKPSDYDAVFSVIGIEYFNIVEINALSTEILNKISFIPIILPSGATITLPLHEVMLQRFLKLLFLTEAVPPVVAEALQTKTIPTEVAVRLAYCGRQSIYRLDKQAHLLANLIQHFNDKSTMTLEKTVFVHEFIQTYKPTTIVDMLRQLDALIVSCEADMVTAVERSYHHEEIKMGSAGSDDDFIEAETIRVSYRNTIRLCQLVKSDLV